MLNEYVRGISGDTVILSFSRGKDSIGSWIELKRHFKTIIPVFLYLVPELEFEEESLKYYEDVLKTRIIRVPHPSIYRWLKNFVFQAPGRLEIIEKLRIPNITYDHVFKFVKHDFGIPENTYVATGVRACDSINRRGSIKLYGPINLKRKTFFPVFDWNSERLYNEIEASGIKLPIDYKLFGRTFDGMDYRFIKPIKDNMPDDYQKIIDWFPLAELEILRFEWRENEKVKAQKRATA
jgi:hypothetical protein